MTKNHPTILVLLLFLIISCNPPEGKSKMDVINERMAKKLKGWNRSVDEKCEREVLELAASIVDSTLIANARKELEKMGRPPRPLKPGHPDFVPPEDSIPVAPLVNFDSLLIKDSINLLQMQLDSLSDQ